MHSFYIAADPARGCTNCERASPGHSTKQFPSFCGHQLEQQLRRREADMRVVPAAVKGALRAALYVLERGNLQRHHPHLIVSHSSTSLQKSAKSASGSVKR